MLFGVSAGSAPLDGVLSAKCPGVFVSRGVSARVNFLLFYEGVSGVGSVRDGDI